MIGFWGYSQTEVYFKYDEAGSQRYRGPDDFAKQQHSVQSLHQLQTQVLNEKDFWKQVRLYPVPVK